MGTALALCAGLLTVGCAKQQTAPVTISSGAYSTNGAGARYGLDSLGLYTITPSTMALADVSEFKFCVSRIKLEDEGGEAKVPDDAVGESGEKNPSDFRFEPGLIDVSTGAAKDWGTVEIPVGFKVSRIKIKVHKDRELCGQDYSLRFNGQETGQDIEFRWKFNPAVELDGATKALEVSFSEVVEALRSAASAGQIASMKEYVEAAEGTASQKE